MGVQYAPCKFAPFLEYCVNYTDELKVYFSIYGYVVPSIKRRVWISGVLKADKFIAPWL